MSNRTISGSARWVSLGAIALFAAGTAGWFLARDLGPRDQPVQGATAVQPARSAADAGADEYLSGPVTLALREEAGVRDFPSHTGGAQLRTLAGGAQVTGRWVRGAGGTDRWLRLADGGYLPSTALVEREVNAAGGAAAPTDGAAIGLAVSNRGCNWGPGIEPYIQRAIAQRQARYPDGVPPEDYSSFVRVGRNWHGLTVTAVAVHWESTSVYFRQSVADVRAVLRAQGVEVADDGAMPIRNEEAVEAQSLDAPSGEGRNYGAASITCGI